MNEIVAIFYILVMVELNIITKYISLSTQGEKDIVDITDNLRK
jgi:hypothetical protein